METKTKVIPPLYQYEDMPVDTHLAQTCQSLGDNIYRYSASHGDSSYLLTSSGSVAQTVTSADYGVHYLLTLMYRGPKQGRLFSLATLRYVSAAAAYSSYLYVFDPSVPYISDTASLGAYRGQSLWSYRYDPDIATTTAQWNLYEPETIPGIESWPDTISMVIGCNNPTGVSRSMYLYAASLHWSR